MTNNLSFFNLGSGQNPYKVGKSKGHTKKIGCAVCKVHPDITCPKVLPIGKGNKKILLLTEYMSGDDDCTSSVLSGYQLSFLKKTFKELGFDLDSDCWRLPAVRCRLEDDRVPSPVEIKACRSSIFQYIEKLKPSVIISMGPIAIASIYQHRTTGRLTGLKMTDLIGYRIPDQELKTWVCPTYSVQWISTSFVKDKGKNILNPVLLKYWRAHFKQAFQLLETEFPIHDYSSKICTTTNPEKAIKWINKCVESGKDIAFDYEATGIKPHRQGHQIKSCSISDGDFSYAFPYFENHSLFVKTWYRFLRTANVGKIAHKLDYENAWGKFQGPKTWTNNWVWDTCLAVHCIRNNGLTGQKFHVLVNFGILGYDDEVDSFLTSEKIGEKDGDSGKLKKGKNAFNCIDHVNLKQLLKYNAEDALYCAKLAKIQKEQLTGKMLEGFKFFLEGAEALSKIQNEGMLIDVTKMTKHEKMLQVKIDDLLKELKATEEWGKWKGKTSFNPNSDVMVSRLLYEILSYKKPAAGSLTDESQLNKIGTEFTRLLIKYRKYNKMKNTYLAQFLREEVDGVIRPFFNLHLPATFRSSADSPNFQNMPARDPEALKWVMSCIVPRKGNRLIEWDYKGVEVTVSACNHKDPNMIKYILDPTTDMHRDTAADIIMKKPEDVTKSERQMLGKNGYVFPAFYGSGPPALAPTLWERITSRDFTETYEHLKKQGIKKYVDFEAHVKEVHEIFWNERFPVYNEWKRKIYHDYLKKGYVELYTGFRCYGPMDYTQVTNYPIQGPAFHCLLWSLTHIYREVVQKFEKSFLIGQIHDAMVGDVHPQDEAEIDSIVKLWGTQKIREHWDWIILPMQLEKVATPVDGSWNTMNDEGYL